MAVNWTEIEGRFFMEYVDMCPPTVSPISSSINISAGCVCKSVIGWFLYIFVTSRYSLFNVLSVITYCGCFYSLIFVGFTLLKDFVLFSLSILFYHVFDCGKFTVAFLSLCSSAVIKSLLMVLLHGLSALNVSKLGYFHYLPHKSISLKLSACVFALPGSKLVPFWSWLQMGRDLIFIRLRYITGAWKLESSHKSD